MYFNIIFCRIAVCIFALQSALLLEGAAPKPPLIEAVEKHNGALVQKLLKEGADPNMRGTENTTPLMLAAALGFNDIVRALLAAHATVDTQNDSGYTALMFAVEEGNKEIVDQLLATGANPNIKTKRENTALMAAVAIGQGAIVEKLLAKGAKLEDKDDSGTTALMTAVIFGKGDMVDKLLALGANLQEKDKQGNTALMFAVKRGRGTIVDKLLAAGAGASLKNDARMAETLMQCAFTSGSSDMVAKVQKLVSPLAPIFNKIAYLSFEDNDWNNAIIEQLKVALLLRPIGIVNAHIVQKLVKTYPALGEYLDKKIWSLFKHKEGNLYVIIPEPIENTETLHLKYGLRNLVGPILDVKSLKVNQDSPEQKIKNFSEIIDKESADHPQQFILGGHGFTGLVAAIPIQFFGKFLETLSDIDAKFLYIISCYAAGQNLVDIQSYLQKIIEQKLKQMLIRENAYERGFEIIPAEITKRGINYAIVIQATSDIKTRGAWLTEIFFKTLDEIYRPKKIRPASLKKEHQQIEDLFKNLLSQNVSPDVGFPSIRLPGTTTFFRAVDLGQMEIITWFKLQALRLEKRLQKGPAQVQPIDIPIREDIHYIQLFPCNLMDCCIDIQSKKKLEFISKIPGQAQHFIGKIKFTGTSEPRDDLEDFIQFDFILERPATDKCWFIKTVEIKTGEKTHIFEDLVINIKQNAYIYRDTVDNRFYGPDVHDQTTFKAKMISWLNDSLVKKSALYEATAGNEDYQAILDEVAKVWGIDKRLIKSVEK